MVVIPNFENQIQYSNSYRPHLQNICRWGWYFLEMSRGIMYNLPYIDRGYCV